MIAKTNDLIRLTQNIPSEGLREGDLGVVVAEFTDPNEAYEVEFSDEDGITTAQLALLPHQFVVVEK